MDHLDPKNWTTSYFPAPKFNRKAFQLVVDTICGTVHGQSIIRLVFGAGEEIEQARQVTDFGKPTVIDMVGRYQTRVCGIKGKVRIRRWILEQWQPPDQFAHESPFVQMPGASGIYIPPHLANERRKGRYDPLYMIADHSQCLPEICNSTKYFCFGEYRMPSNKDLAKLRRITARRNADEHLTRPFEPVSQRAVNLFNKQADEETAAKENAAVS